MATHEPITNGAPLNTAPAHPPATHKLNGHHASTALTVQTLEQALDGLPTGLVEVLLAVAAAAHKVSDSLGSQGAFDLSSHVGSENAFGDLQINADVHADSIIFEALGKCPHVAVASSEETPQMVAMGGSGFSVAFDPLDGSSIVGANFAVGTIFGIWPADTLLGCKGREQAAAAYSIYGPRTLLVLAMPQPGGTGSSSHAVKEFCLRDGVWLQQRPAVRLHDTPPLVCAPGNLKASRDNEEYAALITRWVQGGFSLRYSGGMAPDVHHIVAKGGGVFCYMASQTCPAKLRLLYEAAPLAFIIEAAGGTSHDGSGSILEQTVTQANQRTRVCMGSRPLVEMCVPALQAS